MDDGRLVDGFRRWPFRLFPVRCCRNQSRQEREDYEDDGSVCANTMFSHTRGKNVRGKGAREGNRAARRRPPTFTHFIANPRGATAIAAGVVLTP